MFSHVFSSKGSDICASLELTLDVCVYSPEVDTSIAKANASKSTCQVHAGSCFTVVRVPDGSVHHGDNSSSEFQQSWLRQGQRGLLCGQRCEALYDKLTGNRI